MTLFWGGGGVSGFLVFSSPAPFLCCCNYIGFWIFPVPSPQEKSKTSENVIGGAFFGRIGCDTGALEGSFWRRASWTFGRARIDEVLLGGRPWDWWMVFEASTLDFCLPIIHTAHILSILPFGFFTSFSIPCMIVACLSCFYVELPHILLESWCHHWQWAEPDRFRVLHSRGPISLVGSWSSIGHSCTWESIILGGCSWFRQCVINGGWSNCRLWKYCLRHWRRLRSHLSGLDKISHFSHPWTRHWI